MRNHNDRRAASLTSNPLEESTVFKNFATELGKLSLLESTAAHTKDHLEEEEFGQQIFCLKNDIIQRFVEQSEVINLKPFKDLYSSLAGTLRNPEAFFCYLNFYKIGHYDLDLFKEWLRSLSERKQFILAYKLIETVSARMRLSSRWTGEAEQEIAAAEDSLLKDIQKALAEDFYSQSFYLGRMDDSDSKNSSDPEFGISADDFEDIQRTGFKPSINRINQSSLGDANSDEASLRKAPIRKRKRLSDLINVLSNSKLSVFVDRSSRQRLISQAKERAYEYAFLCKKYQSQLVNRLNDASHRTKKEFRLNAHSKETLKQVLLMTKRLPLGDAERKKKVRRRMTEMAPDTKKLAKRPFLLDCWEGDENTRFNFGDKLRRLTSALDRSWCVSKLAEQSKSASNGTNSDSHSLSATYQISLSAIIQPEPKRLSKEEFVTDGKSSLSKPPPRL